MAGRDSLEVAAFDDVAQFRGRFLAFWFGKFQSLPLSTTSVITPRKGVHPYPGLRLRELDRLQAVSALGYVRMHNYRAYAAAWKYDFEGRSRHPEQVAKRFGISERTLHRRVEEFWEALYTHCHGLAPGEDDTFGRNGI